MVNGGPTEGRRSGHCLIHLHPRPIERLAAGSLYTCTEENGNNYSHKAYSSVKIKVEKKGFQLT